MTLKFDPKRGWASVANELLFAVALMDFAQGETGLVLSALPYMYSAPKGAEKSALINVATAQWLACQRDKSAAYRMLRRLVERGVLWTNSKARYFLNTTFSEWKDRTGALVFVDGENPSEPVRKLRTLMKIHPIWRKTGIMFRGEVNEVDNPGEADPESGRTSPDDSGRASPTEGDVHPQDGGRTSPTEGDVHPLPSGRTSPTPPPEPAEQSQKTTRKAKQSATTDIKAAAEGIPPALEQFARQVCLLSDADVSDLETLARAYPEIPTLTLALERLANSKQRLKGKPGAFLRVMIERINAGESVSIPNDGVTFRQWQDQEQRRAALRTAMQLPNDNNAQTVDKSTLEAARQSDAKRDGARAEREGLADAFAARLAPFQDAAIDEARRGKWPLRLQMAAAEWVRGGRAPWRAAELPLAVCGMLAQLEAIARQYCDPQIEIVAAVDPRK